MVYTVEVASVAKELEVEEAVQFLSAVVQVLMERSMYWLVEGV
jgi:hypothetical protein